MDLCDLKIWTHDLFLLAVKVMPKPLRRLFITGKPMRGLRKDPEKARVEDSIDS
jgi:hypothetical protein